MSKDTKKIIERIEALELEKARLLKLRKEEIFSILQKYQGLTLDNNLLAGLAIYASDKANQGSDLLKELETLGRKNRISKSLRPAANNANQAPRKEASSIAAETSNS